MSRDLPATPNLEHLRKQAKRRRDELRKYNQSGLLPLIYAHLFSLSQIRELFARQVALGKGPMPAKTLEPAEA